MIQFTKSGDSPIHYLKVIFSITPASSALTAFSCALTASLFSAAADSSASASSVAAVEEAPDAEERAALISVHSLAASEKAVQKTSLLVTLLAALPPELEATIDLAFLASSSLRKEDIGGKSEKTEVMFEVFLKRWVVVVLGSEFANGWRLCFDLRRRFVEVDRNICERAGFSQ